MAQPGNPPPTPGDGQILVYDAAIGGVIVCTASTLDAFGNGNFPGITVVTHTVTGTLFASNLVTTTLVASTTVTSTVTNLIAATATIATATVSGNGYVSTLVSPNATITTLTATTATITTLTVPTETVTNLTASTATISAFTNVFPTVNDPNGIHNFATTSTTPGGAAGVYYYLPGTALQMPNPYKAGIVAGSAFSWMVTMSKTAAGTGALNIGIYSGPNGSISDTRLVTQSIGTGTAAVDSMLLCVDAMFTTTTTMAWSMYPATRAATAAGFGVAFGTGAPLNGTVAVVTSTAGNIWGLSYSNTNGTAVITVGSQKGAAFGIT